MKALKEVSDKEQEDVSELEKAGFTKLLYHIINKYDEKMDKEKREAIAALAKYETAKNDGEVHDKISTSVSEVEMVKARIDQISVELKHESDKLDTSINRLEKEREELMADSDI